MFAGFRVYRGCTSKIKIRLHKRHSKMSDDESELSLVGILVEFCQKLQFQLSVNSRYTDLEIDVDGSV